jgi:hypothetical protein
MLKQIEGVFTIEKEPNIGIRGIVVEIRISIGTGMLGMLAKINELDRKYKFYFPVDQQIFIAEYIRSTDMKKGPPLNRVNPWYNLERKTGFGPATPTLAKICCCIS